MGRIARILGFERAANNTDELTLDPSAGANVTAPQFLPTGDDSQPLPTDYALIIDLPQNGGRAVIGYVDASQTNIAEAGEKVIYSRDAEGKRVASVHLKADGSVSTANEKGGYTLAADGVVTINGVTIDTDGKINAPGDVVGAGVSLQTHTHAAGALIDGDGATVTGSTGAPEE